MQMYSMAILEVLSPRERIDRSKYSKLSTLVFETETDRDGRDTGCSWEEAARAQPGERGLGGDEQRSQKVTQIFSGLTKRESYRFDESFQFK